MKDHEIQQVVNELRDIAKEFGETQQLRERIHNFIVPILKKKNIWGVTFQNGAMQKFEVR